MNSKRIVKLANLAIHGPRLNRILTLAKYDYIKRYKGNKFGIFWALGKPVFRLFIYVFVFTQVFNSREENFGLMMFLGLITWTCFSESTGRSMGVLKSKSFLIESIQVNKIDFFIANVITAFIGLLLSLIIYFAAAVYVGVPIVINKVILLIPVLSVVFLLCLGTSLLLSVIHIFFKDIDQLWNLGLILGMWTSGVFNKSEKFIEAFPALEYLNPFLGIISNIRNLCLYNAPLDWTTLGYPLAVSILTTLVGMNLLERHSHKSMERL